MPITILQPSLAPPPKLRNEDSDSDSEGGADLEGDIAMSRPAKRARTQDSSIMTPGEIITDDPQWMRYGRPY